MTDAGWPEALDRLEADALRLVAAAAGSPGDVEVACAAAVDASALALPPLPAELAPRATAVLRTLAEAEAAVAHRVGTVAQDLAQLDAPAGGHTSRYIDRGL